MAERGRDVTKDPGFAEAVQQVLDTETYCLFGDDLIMVPESQADIIRRILEHHDIDADEFLERARHTSGIYIVGYGNGSWLEDGQHLTGGGDDA